MISTEKVQVYAASAKFQKVFKENVDGMFLLSFLLTTDHAKAGGVLCLWLGGLRRGKEALRVSREWARSWAQRTIIRNAIRIVELSVERTRLPHRRQGVVHMACLREHSRPISQLRASSRLKTSSALSL